MNEIREKYLELANSRTDYTKKPLYEESKDNLIDVTMSCDPKECVEQLKHYVKSAYIREDEYTFLAAYDLYESVTKSYGYENEFR